MRHTARRSAFTVIELLVVIAIIAILSAILFPVFAQARARARHNATMNVQFADGRTKAVAYDKLISDVTYWNPYL